MTFSHRSKYIKNLEDIPSPFVALEVINEGLIVNSVLHFRDCVVIVKIKTQIVHKILFYACKIFINTFISTL